MPSEIAQVRNLDEIIHARRIIEGPDDKLRAVSAVKYPWTNDIWKEMLANNWTPDLVPLLRDRGQFQELTESQQLAYKRALAFLSNLDSIQVDNLASNVVILITDPNVRELILRQQYEEVVHVKSYSAIVETLFPQNPMEIYDMYHVVPELGAKNDYIIASSKEVTLDPTSVNKVKALFSNVALEGIYFFSGFAVFYVIGRYAGTMQGSVDMIKYIHRDELVHLRLFSNAIAEIRKERPELFTPALLVEYTAILKEAAELEINWGNYMLGKGIPGYTAEMNAEFIRDRANRCAADNSLPLPYAEDQGDHSWFYSYSNFNSAQKNFFETKPMTYQETRPVFRSRRKTDVNNENQVATLPTSLVN
jgi:ribonucleoside-diphosphate reductase beta chain